MTAAHIRRAQHLALAAAVSALALILAHTALTTALDVTHSLARAQTEGPFK